MYVEVKFADLDDTYKKVIRASLVENTLVNNITEYAYIKITKEFLNTVVKIDIDGVTHTITNRELLNRFLNNPTAYKVKVLPYVPENAITALYMEVVEIVLNSDSDDRKIVNPNTDHPLAIIRSGTASLFKNL